MFLDVIDFKEHGIILAKNTWPECGHEKTLDAPSWGMSYRMKNLSRTRKTEKAKQWVSYWRRLMDMTTKCNTCSWIRSWIRKGKRDIIGTLGKIWMGCVNCMVLHNIYFLTANRPSFLFSLTFLCLTLPRMELLTSKEVGQERRQGASLTKIQGQGQQWRWSMVVKEEGGYRVIIINTYVGEYPCVGRGTHCST